MEFFQIDTGNISRPLVYGLAGVILLFIVIAFFLLLCNVFHVSSWKQTHNLQKLNNQTINTPSSVDRIAKKVSTLIVPLLRMNEVKEVQVAAELDALDIKLTPKEYLAQSITRGLLVGLLSIPCFFVNVVCGLLMILLALIVSVLQYSKLDSIITKRRRMIERELPRFVSVVEQSFKSNKDVLRIIDDYTLGDSTPLTEELKIAVADMKTGNYEQALSRMSNRVGSGYLTETIRGLISTIRGEDTEIYFAALNKKLWENERLLIKKEALKIPKKANYLCTAMMTGMAMIYIVVFGTVIIDGLAEVFGTL